MISKFYENYEELLNLSELLHSFFVPFEYGISRSQKVNIAKQVVSDLCEKVKDDLLWWKSKQNQFDEDYWKYKKNDVKCEKNINLK